MINWLPLKGDDKHLLCFNYSHSSWNIHFNFEIYTFQYAANNVDLGVLFFNIILSHLELIHNERNKKQGIKHKK